MNLVELSEMLSVEEDKIKRKPVMKLITKSTESKCPFGISYDEEGEASEVVIAVSLDTAKKLVTQLNKFIKKNKENQ